MKAVRVLLICLIIFVFVSSYTELPATSASSPRIHGTPTTSENAQAATAAWTVMIYLAADNDLEAFALADLNEMEFVGSTTDVNVVAQIDRAENYDSSNGDWMDARRLFINRDTNLSDVVSEQVEIVGETNTGDPDTLSDFAIWAMTTYPAERYALVVWDHGGSWLGVATDESADFDDLTLPELGQALEQITTTTGVSQLDVVGFDACLMGAFEVYNTIAPYARYGIGSPELIPGNGWDYLGALDALAANPAMDGGEFGRATVDSFIEFYTEIVSTYSIFNLGVVDLSKITDVIRSMEAFSDVVNTDPSAVLDAVSEARNETPLFGAFDDPQYTDYWAAADLFGFMQLLAELLPDTEVGLAAADVSNAGKDMILYYQGSEASINVSGISIFFPRSLYDYQGENRATRYVTEAPSSLTPWQTFLDSFYNSALLVANAAELQGDVKNIAIDAGQVVLELGLGSSVIQTSVLVTLDIGGGESIIIDYIRPDTITKGLPRELTWSGQVPWLSNGLTRVPVLIIKSRYNPELGIINGTFHPQNGLPVKAQLVVDLKTNLITTVWGVRESAGSLMPFEIHPQAGDLFHPTWFTLDEDGKLVAKPATSRLIFPEAPSSAKAGDLRLALDTQPQPFYVTWNTAPSGSYTFTTAVEDVAGNTEQGYMPVVVDTGDGGLDVEPLDPDDPDIDDDGLGNGEDNCPAVDNPDQTDSDGDGIGDVCDLTDDRDPDQDEITEDNCPDVANFDQADTDGDGVGDACDFVSDRDNDGIADEADNCPDVPNPDQTDSDGDGRGDACTATTGTGGGETGLDLDQDGIPDGNDNCPMVANADQTDSDGDGAGDACDAPPDSDSDGIPDRSDNCFQTFNPDQVDSDADGQGDACDPPADSDGDGIPDVVDECPNDPATSDGNLGGLCGDTDGDGIKNESDNCPFTPNQNQDDYDEDGVGTACDNCPMVGNPDQTDSNGNGVGDACEGGNYTPSFE